MVTQRGRSTRARAQTVAVPRLWPGETAVCIASGPSLTVEDVNAVRGRFKSIAINASYAIAPWADVLYMADAYPVKWYWNSGPKGYERVAMRDFKGLKFSIRGAGPGIQQVRTGAEEGLSMDPRRLALGKNSGYQAINLAVLLGATRILLLGYDMRVSASGREYWHEPHPNRKRSPYSAFRNFFHTMVGPLHAAGVEVINCSRETALDAFPKRSLSEMLVSEMESVA